MPDQAEGPIQEASEISLPEAEALVVLAGVVLADSEEAALVEVELVAAGDSPDTSTRQLTA